MKAQVTQLAKSHIRDHFDCGQVSLTRYLKEQASQDVKRHLSLCFVTTGAQLRVTGYYTLSNASVSRDQLPPQVQRKLGYKDIPVTLLGRLAVDITMQGKGHGESLLMDALYRSYQAAQRTSGSVALVTDPIDEAAAEFYKRYGFIRLEGSQRMCIMMETIGRVFESG
ncbi:MAG: GNAT family N-acetyltransferase [Saprospiraceae bacterium]